MKNSKCTLIRFLFTGLFVLYQFYSISQNSTDKNSDSTVSIELSIPHSSQMRKLNDCASINNDVFIIIHNNTDSTIRFYENWNSYGYYNFTFEIKTLDTNYTVSRPHKFWYRNFPSHHSVFPDESIVFQFELIDTACASSRINDGVFEDGWVGFPNTTDNALIRVIYSLPKAHESYLDRTNRKLDYLEYLDPINSSNEINPKEITNRIYIYSQTLVSEWQKVIISK